MSGPSLHLLVEAEEAAHDAVPQCKGGGERLRAGASVVVGQDVEEVLAVAYPPSRSHPGPTLTPPLTANGTEARGRQPSP